MIPLVPRSDKIPAQKVQKDSKLAAPQTSQNKTKTKQTKKTNDRNQADASVNKNQELSQPATTVIIGDSS